MIALFNSHFPASVAFTAAVFLLSSTAIAQELAPLRPISTPPYQIDELQDRFLQWPESPGVYEAISGQRMQTDIIQQQEISRRYRDLVNSQYWGRIIGSSSDLESAEWLAQRYRDLEIG